MPSHIHVLFDRLTSRQLDVAYPGYEYRVYVPSWKKVPPPSFHPVDPYALWRSTGLTFDISLRYLLIHRHSTYHTSLSLYYN